MGVDFGNLVTFSFLFSPSDILEVDMCFQEQQHKSLFFFSPFFLGGGVGEGGGGKFVHLFIDVLGHNSFYKSVLSEN